MVQSKRFQPVKRVAESRERTAAKALGDSQRWAQEQESKLQELKNYHLEYLQRFQSAAKMGMSASQLLEYRAFIEKLERAISEQEKVVAESQQRCNESKEAWMQKRMRNQVLGKVMDRFKSAEQKAELDREQKITDEGNQRQKD